MCLHRVFAAVGGTSAVRLSVRPSIFLPSNFHRGHLISETDFRCSYHRATKCYKAIGHRRDKSLTSTYVSACRHASTSPIYHVSRVYCFRIRVLFDNGYLAQRCSFECAELTVLHNLSLLLPARLNNNSSVWRERRRSN